jgi:hypothetical protein
MNTVEEYDHSINHRLGEEGMNMMGIHMVEVEGMDMVEERPSSHRLEVEDMDMVEERPSSHRPKVEGIDRGDSDIVEVKVIEREYNGVVFVMHWIGDGVERHR